jgi:Fuc2NAc and GlcNAc transferase
MSVLWLLPLAVAMSGLLTGALHRYAIAYRVLDIPNERSAHMIPTPRGGGVAIGVTFLTSVALLSVLGVVEANLAIALIGSGVIVTLVGFMDDHRPIAVHWRLLVHLAAVVWALMWLGGLPPVEVAGLTLNLGWLGHVLAAIALVWLLNLYNFMDGIDGIAGFEAVTVGLAAALLYLQPSAVGDEWLLPALLAMAALGFLFWNWPPAKIFMGDAGSGFLGLMLGVVTVRAAWLEPALPWTWVILLGVFIVDATLTLLRRLRRYEPLQQGHHEHAYQHARRVTSHQTVTLAVGAINAFWLLPIALTVRLDWLTGAAGVLIAYAPLLWLAIRFKAGLDSADAVASNS